MAVESEQWDQAAATYSRVLAIAPQHPEALAGQDQLIIAHQARMSLFIKEGQNHRPHVSIVCNFSKATETQPALLQFEEVLTLFHEFGHALHGILANTKYSSLSGTSVSWDFVELPSQLFENWCYQEEALNLFAKHFETDEVIPIEDIRKLKQAANFQDTDSILDYLDESLRSGDVVVILSNGGFDNIHQRLLARLQEK